MRLVERREYSEEGFCPAMVRFRVMCGFLDA